MLLMAAPLLLFPGGWRSLALLVLPLIWFGNRLVTGHFAPRTPYDAVIVCLLAMVLVSITASAPRRCRKGCLSGLCPTGPI